MDRNDLHEQFPNPTAGLNPMQQQWYASLMAGAEIHPVLLRESKSYAEVVQVFQSTQGTASSSSRDKFLEMKQAEQAFYRTVAAEHAGRYKAQQNVVDAAVLFALNGQGSTPREALEAGGVPTAEVRRIGGKPGSKRKVKRSLQKHQQHPNAQRMILNEGKREYMRMADDTLAGSLEGVYVNMRTQARLSKLEREQAAQAAEIAELKARLALIDTRHEVEDAGIDPKAEAQRMRAGGMSIGAIATALGRRKSSVQRWL
ncbi:helix-turn-helix domain-containing protein [Pseudomonas oryzihabitans]|uniref:helix-turn-helix domain-containing protein n=1 Tax=Pseudomonas oryzihabitans TaxID=47885 RepID=UPI0021B32667|nr:helix-turn-helix domain-containing protein [Pseudomonas psychrotolerans]